MYSRVGFLLILSSPIHLTSFVCRPLPFWPIESLDEPLGPASGASEILSFRSRKALCCNGGIGLARSCNARFCCQG